jgi:hypothetical protein
VKKKGIRYSKNFIFFFDFFNLIIILFFLLELKLTKKIDFKKIQRREQKKISNKIYAIQYFEEIGLKCPEYTNTADFLVDELARAQKRGKPIVFKKMYFKNYFDC